MINNECIYLSIDQGFALVEKISELKENPYFKDDIAESFVKEVYARATEITVNSVNNKTNLLQKLKRNGDKIMVPKSRFEYLTILTEIDVFDEDTMTQFMTRRDAVSSSIQTEHTNLRRR